jgi:hypothetical protein
VESGEYLNEIEVEYDDGTIEIWEEFIPQFVGKFVFTCFGALVG